SRPRRTTPPPRRAADPPPARDSRAGPPTPARYGNGTVRPAPARPPGTSSAPRPAAPSGPPTPRSRPPPRADGPNLLRPGQLVKRSFERKNRRRGGPGGEGRAVHGVRRGGGRARVRAASGDRRRAGAGGALGRGDRAADRPEPGQHLPSPAHVVPGRAGAHPPRRHPRVLRPELRTGRRAVGGRAHG